MAKPEEITPEKLVAMIQGVSAAMKVISGSKLKTDIIITLIHDKTKISKRDIKLVLEHLDKIESLWLKK